MLVYGVLICGKKNVALQTVPRSGNEWFSSRKILEFGLSCTELDSVKNSVNSARTFLKRLFIQTLLPSHFPMRKASLKGQLSAPSYDRTDICKVVIVCP